VLLLISLITIKAHRGTALCITAGRLGVRVGVGIGGLDLLQVIGERSHIASAAVSIGNRPTVES